ncbi:MAG TPA: hypothetical protein VM914_10010 [Pyrinomonadaceae bacterium]|jgi:ElaB/YqjD/DUF883 family membrane-anchored ribosome-binding protein|nr:hypothetical protein [Pyrinomonadaceae bacterium]
MSQNKSGNDTPNFGGAGTGATDAGTTRDTSTGGATGSTGTGSAGSGGGGLTTTGGGGGSAAGTATAPASGIAGRAKEYGQTVVDAASQAREFITDKAGVVGEKIQGLREVDYQQYATQAKDYARQNPGQALLVAAAAGFVIGLLARGGRR